jgi:hypothetical protein
MQNQHNMNDIKVYSQHKPSHSQAFLGHGCSLGNWT